MTKLDFDFQNNLGFWVISAAKAYERAMKQSLQPTGIRHREGQVLCLLAMEGQLSQVTLAEKLDIEPPSLVRVLDRMEQDGLIIRETCTTDRRVKLIRALPKARSVWKKINQCRQNVQTQAQSSLTSGQLEQMQAILQTVMANLGTGICNHVPEETSSPPVSVTQN